MEAITIKMFFCKGCNKVRRHGRWIYMSQYQKELMVKFYQVLWEGILCEECKKNILAGKAIV